MERKLRTYKIKDKPYQKAKKRAKGKLATLIEHWVTLYGNCNLVFIDHTLTLPIKSKLPNNKPK